MSHKIPTSKQKQKAENVFLNHPDLWIDKIKYPQKTDNKYTRGNVVAHCGEMHGASIFVAEAARRAGAGLAFITCNKKMYPIVSSHTIGVIVKELKSQKDYNVLLNDERKNVFVFGPGQGVNKSTKSKVLQGLKAGKKCAIDADAIMVFKNNTKELFSKIKTDCILTPHLGEFEALFEYNEKQSKIELARKAAKISNATVLIKGYETVVARPDGKVVVNTNSSPLLSTGGTGDILSGMIAGFTAQGMSTFDAACISTYLHGEIAKSMKQGFIAEDLLDELRNMYDYLAKF